MKNFVVVVDTQYDFMMPDGILYVKGAEETIVPMIQYLTSLKAETTAGVLFTFDTHTKEDYEGSPEAELFPLHCRWSYKGHKNILDRDFVHPQINKMILQKDVFNLWDADYTKILNWDSGFFEFLETNKDQIEIVDIIGVALNFCVKQAVEGFVERGFKVRLHTSMTRGIDTGKAGDLDARVLFAGEIALGKVIVVD